MEKLTTAKAYSGRVGNRVAKNKAKTKRSLAIILDDYEKKEWLAAFVERL